MVAKTVDFTNVKDGGGTFNKRHVTAGDYPARITKVTDSPSKKDNVFQWCFTITTEAGGTYPYYCKLQENQLWKLRNICMAAGMNVPKKKLKLDPEKLVGKRIAVTLEDDEYEGKMQSVVEATFPLSELTDGVVDDDDANDDDDDDDEDDTPPAKLNGGKKAKPAPVDEDEDDEEDEEDEDEAPAAVADDYTGMNRSELKQALKILDEDFQVKKSMTDDDLRAKCRELDSSEEDDDEEDEEPTPPPAAKKKAKAKAKKIEVSDDELDELDIDDL